MYNVILVIHIMAALALIAMVLVQRSSGDGMGLSGSSSSNSFLSGRAAASFATRATALLATIFILTSLSLGVITTRSHTAPGSIADKINALPVKQPAPVSAETSSAQPSSAPAETPAAPAPAQSSPSAPATTTPSVPKPE